MSDPSRFQRVDAVFAEALESPPTERAAFLQQSCAGDAALRAEVERLLDADAAAGTFLEPPALSLPDPAAGGDDDLPRRLGAYLLEREIGSGGMGTVYEARRADQHYERQVAIKVLRAEVRDAEAVHRFIAERQILARLEHPGIARLYDGGTTDEGRPFLVMELVDGLPIDRYCDRRQLSIDQRLALFQRVCAAVQHAHQSLLVHRDLKPANILVTPDGGPKLLDFGIAKQLAPDASGNDLTRTGSRLMTPSYASPEQIRGEPITTASDVYSLGVLLYQLLAGRSPYRVASDMPYEIERAICEQQPEPPSQALLRRGDGEPSEAIARARATRVAPLRRKLRGDLDTIVATALRKDPARRYGSAAELAADLDKHLQHLPVAARRDTLLYRTRKLLRRRRGAAAAIAAVLLIAVVFVLGLVEQGRHLARERDKARYALDFLVDTFRHADPYQTRGEHLTAKEILDQGAARVERDLAGRPDVQAAVMEAIGEVDLGLGRADAAAALLAQAVDLRRASPATSPADLANSLEALAKARYELSNFAAAQALLREAVALRRRSKPGPELAKALNQLGVAVAIDKPTPEVEALHREALDLARRVEGERGPTVAESLILLGRLAGDRGDYKEAERLYREGLAIESEVLAPKDPKALRDHADLAVVLLDGGKPKEAEDLLVKTFQLQRQALGSDHRDLTPLLNNLGMARHAQGNFKGAEAAYRETLALLRPTSGDANLQRAMVLGNLAATLQAQDRLDESVPLLSESLELRRRSLGDRHPLVAQVLLHLARAERMRGHLDQGLDLARQALAITEQTEGPDHPHVAFSLREIGNNYMAQKDAASAEPHLRRALDLRRRALSPQHPETARAQVTLAACLLELGRVTEAEALLREGRATLAAQFGANDERVQEADQLLAAARRSHPTR